MNGYEIYVFVLCLIVFALLTAVFSVLIASLVKASIRLIAGGLEDKRILAEYEKSNKQTKKTGWFERLISVLFSVVVCVLFGFSIAVKFMDKQMTSIPQFRVVLSDSMQEKYEENEYLFENNLNDQFSRFDLVITHKLPDEFDLKTFDIVVYEAGDGTLLIHRIVKIEEPAATHPNERWFWLQGDNVQYPDKFPVKYEHMKAIYRGERIPAVGSFVAFLQSPAGILCVAYILFGVFAIPAMENKIGKEEEKRLTILLQKQEEEKLAKANAPKANGAVFAPFPFGQLRVDNGYMYGVLPPKEKQKEDRRENGNV